MFVHGPADVRALRAAWGLVVIVCAVNACVWGSAYETHGQNPACGIVTAISIAYLVRAVLVIRSLPRGYWVLA